MSKQQRGRARSMVVGSSTGWACQALLASGTLLACGERADAQGVAAALTADGVETTLESGELLKRNDGAHAAGWHRGFHPRKRHHHRRHRPPEEQPPAPCDDALSLEEIAGGDGEWLIGPAAPALDNAGELAFAATDATGVAHVLVGSGGLLAAVSLEAEGLELPLRVALDDAGHLAFLAATSSSGNLLGAFSTDLSGSGVVVHYAAEEGGGLGDDGSIISDRPLALAPNGMLAFSSIRDGRGALYRGPVDGSLELVRTGSGDFFNQQQMDVNAGGTVALQMEHNACGLQRGILLFDEPGAEIADIDKAIAGLSVGQQPDVALNDAGVIAFALPGTLPAVQVLRCPVGQPAERFDVALGVYTATRTPLSELPDLTLLADNAGPFASFGSVDIDSEGRVVFEAVLDSGQRGIFMGPDPVADKIVAVGDELKGEVVSGVQLGQLNDSCQLSFATESASGRKVWRADGIAR